ncbi:peptidase S24 [Candidatus Parcubacteria bacterium]|nr:peptidase S24 [Candidatus Parcubacteria bacterium]
MKKLHHTQEKLLKLLKNNIVEPLTIRELQADLGVSSPSVVYHHILQLEKKGYLRRNPGNPQDYQILADGPDKKIAFLNLYGMAQCGPNGSMLDGNPTDRIPISTKILGFSSADAFLVRAKGDSMEPKIKGGDLVIVKKGNKPEDGNIVVCVNNGEALIKKIQQIDNDKVFLTSLNQSYKAILADKNNFKVEGIVKGILSYTE